MPAKIDLAAITAAEDPAAAARVALEPIFTQGEACKAIFERLFKTITAVEDDDGALCLTLVNDEGEDCELLFDPPFTGEPAADVPPSFLALVRAFNGLTYEGYLPMGLNGLGASGSIKGASGGWEHQALLEAEEANAAFLAKLTEAGLSSKDVPGPIDYFQNWLVLNPAETNKLGEPALYFVSHGDCEAVPVTEAADLKWGPILLRLLDQAISEEAEHFASVYD